MVKRDVSRLLIILFCGMLLSSCGFHLRGVPQNSSSNGSESIADSRRQDSKTVYLAVTTKDKVLFRQIRTDLALSGFTPVEQPENAAAHLVVISSWLEKNAIGIDQFGRSNEYEVSLQIEYLFSWVGHLQKAQKTDELERQILQTHRSFYIDNNDPIGKKTEEASLVRDMRRELSRKLIVQFTQFSEKQFWKQVDNSKQTNIVDGDR